MALFGIPLVSMRSLLLLELHHADCADRLGRQFGELPRQNVLSTNTVAGLCELRDLTCTDMEFGVLGPQILIFAAARADFSVAINPLAKRTSVID